MISIKTATSRMSRGPPRFVATYDAATWVEEVLASLPGHKHITCTKVPIATARANRALGVIDVPEPDFFVMDGARVGAQHMRAYAKLRRALGGGGAFGSIVVRQMDPARVDAATGQRWQNVYSYTVMGPSVMRLSPEETEWSQSADIMTGEKLPSQRCVTYK